MRRITILVLLCLTLAGCGKPPTYWDGQLAEAEMEHGTVTSFVLDLGAGQSVGIFVTEDTRVESEVDILSPEAFLTAPRSGTGMVVYPVEGSKAAEMEIRSGERIDAFPARSIYLHTALSEETAPLPDGSTAEVWKGGFGQEEYRLPDGTVLLRLDLNFRNGAKSDLLSAAAQERVCAYYQERPLLRDPQTELERAYTAYLDRGDEPFSGFVFQQELTPVTANDRLIWYLNRESWSVDRGRNTDRTFTDAFDRSTGERIPTEELFCLSRAETAAVLAEKMQGGGVTSQMLVDAFDWNYVAFHKDRLIVDYPGGSLPVEEVSHGWGFSYEEVSDLLRPWAIPETAA